MSGLARQGKAATLVLASAAVLFLFALAYPRTVHPPLLGSDWQCSRTLILTSCTHIGTVKQAFRASPRRAQPPF